LEVAPVRDVRVVDRGELVPDVQESLVRSEADLPVELGRDAPVYRDRLAEHQEATPDLDAPVCRGRSAEDRQAVPDPDARAACLRRGRSAVG